MAYYLIALALFIHGIGHTLFLANAWGYWHQEPGRAWVFSEMLQTGQTSEGIVGLLWIVPMVGFLMAAGGYALQAEWWRPVALTAATSSVAMMILFWGSLNPYSAFFALVFNVAVITVLLWQQYEAPTASN